MTRIPRLAVGVVSAVSAIALGMPAWGQPALEEIVVTARKREESLQEIPIAITAFSADQLEKAGFKDLHELSLNVAGLQYHSMGLAIPGRVNSAIRFRGMDVNTQVPTFQLATLFVDGIFVLGNTESIPFDDIERVEVVKGPQAAYFGRNTFGGAVNYIMKTPSTSEASGSVNATGATYDEYDVNASYEYPLVQDKLAVRLGGRFYSKGAMYTASDGGGLGEESSKSAQGTVYVTPNDSFSIRARAFYSYDEDGPAAGGGIPGRLNDTCSGKTITTKAGETARPVRFFCGAVPTEGKGVNALGLFKLIDSNTRVTSGRALLSTGDANFLLPNLIQKPHHPALTGVPKIEGIEMERSLFRFSAAADYEFSGGMVASMQGGYNKQQVSWARDYTFTPFDNAYSRDPQDLEDLSVEARLASAQDQPLRWLGGINYYEQDLVLAGTGGDSVYLCVDSTPGLAFGNCRTRPATGPNTAVNVFNNAAANSDHVETLGFYGAVTYDFAEQFSLNLEARYQKDTYERGLANRRVAKFNTFVPRAILQYKPTDETNLFASYSKGVLPGEINAAVIDNPTPSTQAQFAAQGFVGQVPAEILHNYEVGWKQQFMDNRIAFNIAAYYADWKNKKSRNAASIRYTCGEGPQALLTNPGCRGAAFGEAGAGQLSTTINGPFFSQTNAVITGVSKIYGFEVEGNAAVTEELTAGWTLNYAGNKFTKLVANFIQPYSTFTNAKGNSHARFPKWAGSFNAGYQTSLTDTWDWFLRGDVSYFGKTFLDVDNLAFCKGYWMTNARMGVEGDDTRIEFWVKNALQDRNWSACARFSEFDLPFDASFLTAYQTAIVAPQNKRQFGLKTSIKF